MFKRIMFSPAMAQAVNSGRKTVTRRMANTGMYCIDERHPEETRKREMRSLLSNPKFCPYQVGDLLAVCEPWRTHYEYDKPSGSDHIPDDAPIEYGTSSLPFGEGRQRLARFMPYRFVRNFLRVTAVRIERLQDITEEDAVREGILLNGDGVFYNYSSGEFEGFNDWRGAIKSFATLIDSLHGEGTWASNPWVWVIDFERVEMANPFNKSVPQVEFYMNAIGSDSAWLYKSMGPRPQLFMIYKCELGFGWENSMRNPASKTHFKTHDECLADLNEYLRGEILKSK